MNLRFAILYFYFIPSFSERDLLEQTNFQTVRLHPSTLTVIHYQYHFFYIRKDLYINERLTTPSDPPRSYAYCSDTAYLPRITEQIKGIDLLFHEATFAKTEAGAIGAGLADGLSGFVVWLPGTIVIKAITAFCFSRKTEKIICVRNLLGIIPALVICVVCYSLYEGIFMAGGFSKSAIISAFGQTPAYCIQVLASSILYIVLGLGFDKAGLKKKFSHLFG